MNNNYQNASLSTNIRQQFKNQHTVLPKEIIKKGFPFTNEPYIFFGYAPEMQKYRYVCYNQVVGNPVFRKLQDDKETISQKLTLDQIRKIGNPTLLELFCFLNRKTNNRGDGVRYMERLQTYLTQYVEVEIPSQLYC